MLPDQIYQREEEVVVKDVPKTKEDRMKEYEAAAKRLDKGLIVSILFASAKILFRGLNSSCV